MRREEETFFFFVFFFFSSLLSRREAWESGLIFLCIVALERVSDMARATPARPNDRPFLSF